MAENFPVVVSLSWFFSALLCILLVTEFVSCSDVESIAENGVFRSGDRGLELGLGLRRKRFEEDKLVGGSVVISGNSTILSVNGTFKLGFFSVDGGWNWYLGIWYASIPIPTYVWVANRESPVKKSLASAAVSLTAGGSLSVTDSAGMSVWSTKNGQRATSVRLLETGNLVLLNARGRTVWQSFDFPANTWLPDMRITRMQQITCWRSPSDPSPGNYSFRLKAPLFGEFELVYSGAVPYWSSGNWTGQSFLAVPEMTVPYIYTFRFKNPFTPSAYFTYTVRPLSTVAGPILTRFTVDPTGVFRQFVWSPQTENWNMFWARPESICRVYNLCGAFSLCWPTRSLVPCDCPPGFTPVEDAEWRRGDYSAGCRREGDESCGTKDSFKDVGIVTFNGASRLSFSGTSLSSCMDACLKNCSCVGVSHSGTSNTCRNFYGQMFNLRNLTSDSADDPESQILYLRVGEHRKSDGEKRHHKVVLVACLVASSVTFVLVVLALAVLRWQMGKGEKERKEEEEGTFSVMQLRVFSYKELHSATRGFSKKLGHGGFGTVFLGELPGNTHVAVKRLERPGSAGEREFRAEVCTIGSVQHVNLVRLRGFCCEQAHRLLVYDFMPNGALSAYIGPSGRCLSWEARFQVAVGTARGIAYLHEECRNCIIHCDIKPENILLDSANGPKVSDFGLAKLMGRDFSRVVATMRGTWGYVAPEWISGVAITAKADVYSYGMTLLELIGGRRNVEGGPDGGQAGDKWFFPPWAAKEIIEGRMEKVVDERLGEEYNLGEAERAGLVAIWCIQDEEVARPTMGTVVKMLEGTVEVAVPPAPQLLQALVAGESFVVDPSKGSKSAQASLSSDAGSVGSRPRNNTSD
ncbi:G-type lectin S-receptor-like serine/threonine-protein kinase SD2-2 [Aristolochia californica]|uniref:G-type lectin S-receptor-like serine/threonine-protein kinase SD2-2 n=1 Tax=Aristolochia californica TaxID=171875 RepID=UPI0035DCCF23